MTFIRVCPWCIPGIYKSYFWYISEYSMSVASYIPGVFNFFFVGIYQRLLAVRGIFYIYPSPMEVSLHRMPPVIAFTHTLYSASRHRVTTPAATRNRSPFRLVQQDGAAHAQCSACASPQPFWWLPLLCWDEKTFTHFANIDPEFHDASTAAHNQVRKLIT